MAAIPTIEPEGYRFDSYIQELQEFFATAGLSYGSLEDILPLVAHLQSSGAFAEDLGSLVRSIILREGGAVARARLVATLVTAIGGEEFEHPPEHLKAPIDQLLAFVTNVLRKPWDEPMSERFAQSTGPVSEARVRTEPMDAESMGSYESPAQSRQPLEFGGYSRSLAAALVAARPQSALRDIERRDPEGADDLRGEETREGLQHPPAPRPEIAAVPLAARSHARLLTGRRMGWIAACAIPAAALLMLLWHTHNSSEIVTRVGPQTVVADSAQPATTLAAKPTAGLAGSSAPATSLPYWNGRHAMLPAASPHAEAGRPDAAPVQPWQADGGQPPAPIERRVEGAEPSESESSISNGAGLRAPSGAPRYLTNGRSSFEITSGVMASHLIAARAPSYPFLARTANVQGEVMLQAIISRTGSVAAVHVLDGHRLLRGAAVAAVRHWRYRPYIADGRPVSVATIVTVDFRSHP